MSDGTVGPLDPVRGRGADLSCCAQLNRRGFLRQSGWYVALVGCGLLTDRGAAALTNSSVFSARSLQEVIAALDGVAASGSDVLLKVPELVEDGAVVPVTLSSDLPDVEALYVIVEGNPSPLAIAVKIPDGTDPMISVRVKMAKSGRVHGVVKTAGTLYSAATDVGVTVGGCA
jgi:sulfur-oxidizing protein SoxY